MLVDAGSGVAAGLEEVEAAAAAAEAADFGLPLPARCRLPDAAAHRTALRDAVESSGGTDGGVHQHTLMTDFFNSSQFQLRFA